MRSSVRCGSIFLTHLLLPLGRTTQCINHTGIFDQQAITSRFNDTAPVFGDFGIDYLNTDRPQPVEGAFLVSPDQPRIPSHICGEDRGEAAGLPHVISPAAKRRPDINSSRSSGLRKGGALRTTTGVKGRSRSTMGGAL